MKMSRYISTALLCNLFAFVALFVAEPLCAQQPSPTPATPRDAAGELADSVRSVLSEQPVSANGMNISLSGDTVLVTYPDSLNKQPSKYVPSLFEEPKLELFQGFTISADVVAPIQYLASDYGGLEGALRLNLKNTYFPVFEAGFAKCDATDENTDISYQTSAPYFRIGVDMNMLKNKFQENRLYVGLRYGFSSFTYDLSGPDLIDPIWGGSQPFECSSLSSSCSWLEFVLGVQVKIWKTFHMGWSLRLKRAFSIGSTEHSDPYYIPGYGTTTNSTTLGATYNLIFDLNWGKRPKQHQEGDGK